MKYISSEKIRYGNDLDKKYIISKYVLFQKSRMISVFITSQNKSMSS